MLVARATAELVRQMCPDVLGGISVFAEELEDGTAPGPLGTEPAEAKTSKRRAKGVAPAPLAALPAPADMPGEDPDDTPTDVPPLPGEPGYDAEEPAVELITDKQNRAIRALYHAVGVEGAATQKLVSAYYLGLDELATHSALTVAQASTPIDELTTVRDGGGTVHADADGQVTVSYADPAPPDAA